MNETRLKFREFYAERFHKAGEGQHWAGSPGEEMHVVNKRLADALADYADYVAEWSSGARWGAE
jgi:hypothetical protein